MILQTANPTMLCSLSTRPQESEGSEDTASFLKADPAEFKGKKFFGNKKKEREKLAQKRMEAFSFWCAYKEK